MQLISATPSPFARKVRISLHEKKIPFELITDVPWNPGTAAVDHNPLGKIPILILDDGTTVYDSRVIFQYIEQTYPEPSFLPSELDLKVRHLQLEALADGVSDAIVLMTIETKRKADLQSVDWVARQRAKVNAGVRAMAGELGDNEWFVGDALGLADIAVACALGYLTLRLPDFKWQREFPALARFQERMEARPSLSSTRPLPQEIVEIG